MTGPVYGSGPAVLHHGDAVQVLADLPADSVDAVVTDPPYLLGFMGKGWDTRAAHDHLSWHGAWAAECLRVLKPGGHLLAFGGTRTYHRLACAVEDAGFEIRDSITWLYGSGFPKSLDVGKAIDKAAGAAREMIGAGAFAGRRPASRRVSDGGSPVGEAALHYGDGHTVTAPATEAAQRWHGWGTALKPASEPIVVARKPLTGTVAANVQQWGTGGLNIDGCRVAATDKAKFPAGYSKGMGNATYAQDDTTRAMTSTGDSCPAGRWPANVVLTHTPGCNGQCAPGCPVAELDQQSGQIKSAGMYQKGARGIGAKKGPASIPIDGLTSATYDDEGGASRFFNTFSYAHADGCHGGCVEGCPVAELDAQSGTSKSPPIGSVTKTKPRHSGSMAGAFDHDPAGMSNGHGDSGGASRFFPTFRYQAKAPARERPKLPDGTSHPTVKPLALMRWLVRLVTPEGGLVLDPFAGSGTTIEACLLEGFRCIAVEADQSSIDLCLQRLDRPAQPGLFP